MGFNYSTMTHWWKSWVNSLEAAIGTDFQSPVRAVEADPVLSAAAPASAATAPAKPASAEATSVPGKATMTRGTRLPMIYAVQMAEASIAEEQCTSSSSSPSRYLVALALRRQSASTSPSEKASSQATLTMHVAPEPSSTSAEGCAVCNIELRVEVFGYDVSKAGKFRQVLLSGGCNCAVLVSKRCLAFVALPAISDKMKTPDGIVKGVPLMNPFLDYVKVLWHPQSDNHLGILQSDGQFQLINLAYRSAISSPEFNFIGGEERVADFVFGAPGMSGLGRLGYLDLWCNPAQQGFKRLVAASEAPWLSLSVIFISANGRITIRCPVLPSYSIQPSTALQSLNKEFLGAPGVSGMAALSEVREWLGGTLLSRAARLEADVPRTQAKEYVAIYHNLHELGNEEAYRRRWHPDEQILIEEETSAKASAKNKGKYCSVALLAQAPVPVLARATTSGIVELLMASGAIGPKFRSTVQNGGDDGRDPHAEDVQQEVLECTVLEEIDLANSTWQDHYLHLTIIPPRESGRGVLLLAQSSLTAIVIESAWVAALASGDDQALAEKFPPARIVTLYDQVACHGHLLGLQPVILLPPLVGKSSSVSPGCALYCLRSNYPSGSKSDPAITIEALDLHRKLGGSRAGGASTASVAGAEAGKTSIGAKSGSATDDNKSRDLSDLHRRISGSTMLPQGPLFGQPGVDGAEGLITQMNMVLKGQLASLIARQESCDTISKYTAAQTTAVKAEMNELRRAGEDLRKEAQASCSKVQRLEERQGIIKQKFEALLANLNKELEGRMLEEAATEELPRLWSQLCELRQSYEMFRAGAAGPAMAGDPSLKSSAHHFKTVEELQRAWTCTYTDRLRAQADDAEKAVAKAVQAMHNEPHAAEP